MLDGLKEGEGLEEGERDGSLEEGDNLGVGLKEWEVSEAVETLGDDEGLEDCKGLEDGEPRDAGEVCCGDILCEAVLGPGPSFLKLPDTLSDASRSRLLGLAGEITSNKSNKGSFCKDGLDNELLAP